MWSPVCEVFKDLRSMSEPVKRTVTYYVKVEHNGLLGDYYCVYAHYPTTEPDTPYMVFMFKENAELFCAVLNAENRGEVYGFVDR